MSPWILVLIIVTLLLVRFFVWLSRQSDEPYTPAKPQPTHKPDSKGFNRKRYREEGFLDIRSNPLYLTTHARERIRERLGIRNEREMEALARDAYRHGKSKFQLMKSERAIIEEKEREYDNSVILIYRGYCYVFTKNNGLKTVYPNTRVRI